jgi:RNA-binding protein YhbY
MEPKIVMCDYRNVLKEINRQLKPHNLKVKVKTNYAAWGDQILLTVEPRPKRK